MSAGHFLSPCSLSLHLTLTQLFTATFASDEEKHYAWMDEGGGLGLEGAGMVKRLFICQEINVFPLLASFPAPLPSLPLPSFGIPQSSHIIFLLAAVWPADTER